MQGLVFCVGLESGLIKLYDIRCFDQGPFATFLVSSRESNVCNSKSCLCQQSFVYQVNIDVSLVGCRIYPRILTQSPYLEIRMTPSYVWEEQIDSVAQPRGQIGC